MYLYGSGQPYIRVLCTLTLPGSNAKAMFHCRSLSYAWYFHRLSFTLRRLLLNYGGWATTLCTDLPSATSAFWHFYDQCWFNSFCRVTWLECESNVSLWKVRQDSTGSDAAHLLFTVQTLYHRAKISLFALRGDCAHEKYLFSLGVRDLKTGIFGVFWSWSGKNPCAGLV